MIREADEEAISERKAAEALKKKCEVAEPPPDCPPK
jgi:hypothetical protein